MSFYILTNTIDLWEARKTKGAMMIPIDHNLSVYYKNSSFFYIVCLFYQVQYCVVDSVPTICMIFLIIDRQDYADAQKYFHIIWYLLPIQWKYYWKIHQWCC